MPVEPDEFRRALGSLAAGVSVITAKTPEKLAGITVTSFTSLSLNPPWVLVCIEQRAWLHDRMPVGSIFGVNILAVDQAHLSKHFARRSDDQFVGIEHSLSPRGAPMLSGVVGSLECEVVQRLPGGDHTIVIGEVGHTQVRESQPLLHFRGKYGQLAPHNE